MKNKIKLSLSMIIVFIILFIGNTCITVYAGSTAPTLFHPIQYDVWKNKDNEWQLVKNYNGIGTDVNSGAVEYNGLRIVRPTDTDLGTVYAKSGDSLGITSWIRTLNENDFGLQYWLKNTYLTLYSSPSLYGMYSNSIPKNVGASEYTTTNIGTSSLTLDEPHSSTGDGRPPSGLAHRWGNLFFMQFGTASNDPSHPENGTDNGKKFDMYSTSRNWNGDFIYGSISGTDPTNFSSWNKPVTKSLEKIQIYDNKPILDISADANGITMVASDSTVGVKTFDYSITGPNGFSKSGTVEANKILDSSGNLYDESNSTNGTWDAGILYSPGVVGAPNTISNPAYNLKNIIPVPAAGNYVVTIKNAYNNLGFHDNTVKIATIAAPPPTGGGTVIPPSNGGTKGTISFVPNSTNWTNSGKSSGYPVSVQTTNQNVGETWIQNYTETVTTVIPATKTDPGSSSSYSFNVTVPFDVTYGLSSISLSGNCSPLTLSKYGGNIFIKEGANSVVNASAYYYITNRSTPVRPSTPGNTSTVYYSVSQGSVTKPSGNIDDGNPYISKTSGSYYVDYTNPTLSIDNSSSYWENHILSVGINAADPTGIYNSTGRSGLSIAQWSKSDSSHYSKNSSNKSFLNYTGSYSTNTSVDLDDGIYSIKANDLDSATNSGGDGNNNILGNSTYYVDTIAPNQSFSIPNGTDAKNTITIGTGVTKKPSIKGTDNAFYGVLTLSDNLSGVTKADFLWTFGNAKDSKGEAVGTYENLYTSPYSYNDRYDEIITKDIEKPVGDYMYLHVKEYDTAGNYSYKTYGPYEDPIALKTFEVTNITDPEWETLFWKDLGLTQTLGTKFGVKQLPVDGTSNSVFPNASIKKGYAFNFDITSEYLYRDSDYIEIKPSFYYYDGTTRVPVDCYYNYNDNPFTRIDDIDNDTMRLNLNTTKYGSVLLGSLCDLKLTKGVRIVSGNEFYSIDGGINAWQNKIQYSDGKTQWWYGRYYLPATSIFVKNGVIPVPQNTLKGKNIIVNFQIIAHKNGSETLAQSQSYDYVANNWTLEGGPKNSNYKNGDVAVYNNSKSVTDDFNSRIIH